MEDQGFPACVLCGEPTSENDIAEMSGEGKPLYGVDKTVHVERGIVHPQCGLDAGWEVS